MANLPFLLVLSTIPLLPSAMLAAAPAIDFDVNYMVGCRDVTTSEFKQINSDEKLIEAKFQVSSLVVRGSEDGLAEYLYRIESPRATIGVVDYLPRTTMVTDVIGNVDIENRREDNKAIGISVRGKYDQIVDGNASVSKGRKSSSSVQYELLPPLELVAASGTTRRGSGAYFKLKPSRRTSLEGAKEFGLVLRVPRDWRGDFVHVHCQANGYVHGVVPLDSRRVICGQATFVVALHLEGDEQAKQSAAELISSEMALRNAAQSHRRAIEKRSFPTVAHRFGKALSLVEPKIPLGWLDYVIINADDKNTFLWRLPQPVRESATSYFNAKSVLHALNGHTTVYE